MWFIAQSATRLDRRRYKRCKVCGYLVELVDTSANVPWKFTENRKFAEPPGSWWTNQKKELIVPQRRQIQRYKRHIRRVSRISNLKSGQERILYLKVWLLCYLAVESMKSSKSRTVSTIPSSNEGMNSDKYCDIFEKNITIEVYFTSISMMR